MRRKADRQNGRSLTYRERWEQMRAFCGDRLNANLFAYVAHEDGTLRGFTMSALLKEMDRLDRVRVVKARPTSRADRAKLRRITRRQLRRRKAK
jgi:hypothetical protein